MIKQFNHKGLEAFFYNGSKAGIQPEHSKKLRRQLTALENAKIPKDMDIPGWELHQLKGSLYNHWSIKVNGNWRLTFTFEGKDATMVDYQDYH
jgi:proteic killer suppression protein